METLDTSPWSLCLQDNRLPPMRCLIQSGTKNVYWLREYLPSNWEEQALAGMTPCEDSPVDSPELSQDGNPTVNFDPELYPQSL